MNFFERNKPWVVALICVLFFAGGYEALFAAPSDFPSGSVVTIAHGASAPSVAAQLAEARLIAHPSVLRFILRLSGTSTGVQAGAYRFAAPQDAFTIAVRLSTGAYGFPPVRLTFPEGITVREAAALVANALPEVSAQDFTKEAQSYEGFLFPDTYLFTPSADAASVVAAMRANFNTKIAPLLDQLRASDRSLSDTVILASLVEKEARTTANRRIVAGILENRLKLGMPLQVDAVFGYIFGRDTYSPSYADLKVDSPYNTYTHKGLPPGPIDNPGLDSLDAVINPTKTDYLYYLTGSDNQMHYATTYAEHQANRRKYLGI